MRDLGRKCIVLSALRIIHWDASSLLGKARKLKGTVVVVMMEGRTALSGVLITVHALAVFEI